MQLYEFGFTEDAGTDQEWSLAPVIFNQINLIVGRNSTGKSRLINTISGYANYLKGKPPPFITKEKAKAVFLNSKKQTYEYELDYDKVVYESFTIDDKVYLSRMQDGKGHVFAEKVNNGEPIEFQVPEQSFAAVVKRDGIQHPFLQSIYDWAYNSRTYSFGSTMGKQQFAIFVKSDLLKDKILGQDDVVAMFRRASQRYESSFKLNMINDLNMLNFDITDIFLDKPITMKIEGAVTPPDIQGINIKESKTKAIIDQNTISQGMFRCISLLIHVNYLVASGHSGCILIDDIGEGLDYERSCLLINLIRKRAIDSNLQLIMSTNDRFVMNSVPLNEWQVLHRNGSQVNCYNIHNSKEKIEDYKFTGLSNFDILTTDYLSK